MPITLPRMCPGTASCSRVFAVVMNSIPTTPMANIKTVVTGIHRDTPTAASITTNRPAETSRRRWVGLPR